MKNLLLFFFLLIISRGLLSADEIPFVQSDTVMYQPGNFYFREAEYAPGEQYEAVPAESRYLYDGGSLPKHDSPQIREFVFSTRFRVVPSLENTDLSMFMGPANYPAEIYLNGVIVNITGEHEKRYNSMTYRSQNILLPRNILNYGPELNTLTIQIFPNSERHRLFSTGISGFYKVEKKVFLLTFLNYNFVQGSVIVSVFLCLFFSLLYIKGGLQEKQYLYFALIGILYFFSYVNMFFDSHANDEVATEIISRMSFPLVTLMLLYFFMEFTKILHRNRIVKIVPLALALLSALVIVVQKDKYGVERVFTYIRNLVVTPTLLFVLVLLFYSFLKRRQKSVMLIFAATLIQTIFGLHDSININQHRVPLVWLIPYGFTLLIISIFIVLAVEQSRMYFKLYRQGQDLEMVRKEVALRKESECKLKEAVKAADAANNAKSLFLANMSHEIRTPLNAILGYSELIYRGENREDHNRYAEILLRESDHLMLLVNKVLDISKIESGKMLIENAVFGIRDVLKSVAENFGVRCRYKGIEFRLEVANDIPETLQNDRVQFQQILNNLLDNALKFTEHGYIRLKVWKDGNRLYFSVKDTGIGIEKQKQESIFESFVQADSSTTRKYGGTGLGISISSQLTRLLGGELTVESTPGEGSSFTFYVPIQGDRPKPEQEQKAEKTELPDFAEYTMLLVEDNLTNQEVICLNLRKTGINIVTAVNGEEGVSRFTEHCPDIVLMDVQMPVLDGYEATRQIRRKSGGSIVPIVGLTANVFEKDRSQCKVAGMDDVLIKPLKQQDLYDLLRKYLLETTSRASENSGSNLSRLEKELDIDRKTALELVTGFISESREGLQIIEDSLHSEDWQTAHRTAHSIKGGAMNVFADRVYIYARKTELFCSEKNLEECEKMLGHLIKAVDLLENTVKTK